MNIKLLQRLLEKSGQPKLIEILVDKFSFSDLQSFLLEIYKRKTKKIQPSHVLHQYMDNRFVKPATVSSQKITQFDLLASSLLPEDFDVLELSPVAPLGSCSVIAPVSQNNVISTIRNTEVCSDATNTLALEAAVRRRSGDYNDIKLAASHRLLRAQKFEEPAAFAHFRIFSICTCGTDSGNYTFENRSLKEHLDYYLSLFSKLAKSGILIDRIRIVISAYSETLADLLNTLVEKKLAKKHSGSVFEVKKTEQEKNQYYQACRFQIFCGDKNDRDFLIVDGGFTDWTAQLLNNKKERMLTSGIGSERLIHCFG